MQSKIEELEKKLNYLYDKEVSRVLSESKLIEEIIRLEKLEERMAKMVGFLEREKIDIRKIESNITEITDKKIAGVAAEITSQKIMKLVIRRLESMSYNDYYWE